MTGLVADHDSRRTRASFADNSANSNQVMPSPSRSAPEAYQTASEATSCGIDFSPLETSYTWKGWDSIAVLGLSLGPEEDREPPVAAIDFSYAAHQDYHGYDHGLGLFGDAGKPFHRWIKTLQRRAQRPRHRRSRGCSAHAREAFPGFLQDSFSPPGHRRSSSGSSFGYVAAVRSASVSVAGSVMTRSRRNTMRTSYHARTDRGSRASTSGARLSEDSMCYERPLPLDPAVKERLLQRRRVIEELISTEESYIGDIKFLMNVYVTILASLPTQHQGLRSSINRNLTDIVELHEEILGELHRVVPNAEYPQLGAPPSGSRGPARSGHQRWHSLDSVPENKKGTTWLEDIPGMTTDPSVAADVAQIFGDRMYRFFVYEEYGAKYEMMVRDVASTHRTMPQWEMYQKGLEALAASLGSANHHLYRSRKSLTIGDLLVKPIQRICKYPLLFAELLKHTPVYDCPNSHAEIEDVLVRLREATAEINRATDDPSVKARMEKTWLLQDRLVFPDHVGHPSCQAVKKRMLTRQCSECSPKSSVRSLGQVQLCGALHVCWQTRKGVNGQYMVCVLYKDALCLATAEGLDQHYMVQACISLNRVKIEEADNGRGLQCHTAPFSWKLVFEVDHQLYEVVMTACSPKEEFEWRTRLGVSIPNECEDRLETPLCGSLALGIKSLGTVFGKPGTVARRLSIHRATTVGPKSPLCQVILKNTTTVRETSSAGPGTPINRSQSLLTTNARIPVLAPARGERARLEALLADVWSRSVLPFPGITNRSRSEHLVRSSASAMKRKLSVASITNSFMKRSPSLNSMNKAHDRNVDRTGDRGRDWLVDKGHYKMNDIEAATVQEEGYYPHVNELVESLVTLDCDFSTLELGLEEDFDHVQGRLPAIRDEVERGSSCSTGPSLDTESLPETIRKVETSKLDAWWPSDEAIRQSSPILRTTSPNSSRHCPSPFSNPPSPACDDKENVHYSGALELPVHGTGSGAAKTASKWSKAGVLNRSLVTNSLRSFFR